ncbi:FadR/GntR family transcriptional regulator [Ruegeria sp. SCPT10]|uniref:FadR/GntR family transcriptional regulator n=1 Tax=Ruegeria sp. SCP10 TaxID=3141377 RepID=UPI00333BB8D7
MNLRAPTLFQLPNPYLSSLPTGAVKDVVNALGHAIANGAYAEGSTIPMESDLMMQFDVSRTVIREAIKVLSGKGMVRTARRYGTRVCPFSEWTLLDPDVIRWHDPDSPAAAQIYAASTDMRCIVEPEAAALAAQNATPAQRETILAAAKAITPDLGGAEAMIAADYAFHATILEATGNVMLAQLQGLIQAVLQFSYIAGPKAAPDEKVSRRNHIKVAEAIKIGDDATAKSAMHAMLKQNRAVAVRMK